MTEDEKAEAGRTVLALVRASLAGDKEAVQSLLGGAGKQELRALVLVSATVISDLYVRLSVVHAVTDDEETRALVSGGSVTSTVLADPAARADIEAAIAATQLRFSGQG